MVSVGNAKSRRWCHCTVKQWIIVNTSSWNRGGHMVDRRELIRLMLAICTFRNKLNQGCFPRDFQY